jgi:hypothetical protein
MKLVDSKSYFVKDNEVDPLATVAGVDNPYDLPFISDLRKRQCLLCLCLDGISEEALAVLSYHLTLLRSAKPLERLCRAPWGDPKIRWRYDTQENVAAMLGLKPRKVQSATTELRNAGILLVGGLHYPKGHKTRHMFYRVTDAAQDALALLTVPYADLFKGETPFTKPFAYETWNEAYAPSLPEALSLREIMREWRTLSADALGAVIDTAIGEAMGRVDPTLSDAED